MSSRDQSDRPVILLVEEDSRQRKDIMSYLSQEEFRVFQAGDTDGALSLLESRTDVRGLVTDAHVTGTLDGYELARLVRERWPAIAVVVMSGRSDASSGAVPDGAYSIAKPDLFEHLAPTLHRMIEQAK